MGEPGWLYEILEQAKDLVDKWPEWKRQEAFTGFGLEAPVRNRQSKPKRPGPKPRRASARGAARARNRKK